MINYSNFNIVATSLSMSKAFNLGNGLAKFNNSSATIDLPLILIVTTKQPLRGFSLFNSTVKPFDFNSFSILSALVLNASRLIDRKLVN